MDDAGSPLGDRPRMIKVTGDLTELRLALPRRTLSPPRHRRRVLLGVGAFVLLANLSGFAMAALQPHTSELASALVGLTVALTALAPYVAFAVFNRRNSDQSRIRLTPHILQVEGRRGRELPLEEVRDIEVVTRGDRGFLRFSTLQGAVDLCDGLFHHELEWVRRVVLHNTRERRALLEAEGHDVDRLVRAPSEIEALRQR